MDWVGLVEAPDQVTAEMWCELLQKEGIQSFAKLSASGGIYGGALLGSLAQTGCWVMVHEDDIDRAAAILRPIDRRQAPAAPKASHLAATSRSRPVAW